MDKNAIKKYAVWARRELITRVSQRAEKYDITAEADADASSVNGVLLTDAEKKQRKALIDQVKQKGFDEAMEEVAYTWFNRFIALRFMEVNGYLPSHIRVFTDDNNNFKPQILAEAIHLELDGLDMEKVYEMKNANENDELYKYLIIIQCNDLSRILPGMFQKISDYTELLFPDNILREGSAIEQMIELIQEDDWKDAVQIIGWLYQYYNSEKKDDVFAALKNNVKITKDNIPAATQLFTPDWIVRYMVENSLGRLWIEGHPQNAAQLLPTETEKAAYIAGDRNQEDSKWHYYLNEAEQEPDVQKQLAEIRKEYAELKPEDIKCIDPCMGSGHILAYIFDVLMKIYDAYGYSSREAVETIVKNNIYGLDIDDRAAQLANFAIMMKARQYDRRFFSRGVQPHVYAIVESNHVDSYAVDYFANGDAKLTKAIKTIIEELHDAKEYGSILTLTEQDWDALYARFGEIQEDINISREMALNELLPLVRVAQALAQKYDVVVTNPPYMGIGNGNVKIVHYVKDHYPSSKADLFAIFIEKCNYILKKHGHQAMITQQGWMFLGGYERLRKETFETSSVLSMVQLGAKAFDEIGGEVVQTTTFILGKGYTSDYIGQYRRLIDYGGEKDKEAAYLNCTNGTQFYAETKTFKMLPSYNISYWLSEKIVQLFQLPQLSVYADACKGMDTGNNDKYMRFWYEVDISRIGFVDKIKRWIPYNKGGGFRKWFGLNYYVIDWNKNGYDLKNNGKANIRNEGHYFEEGLTWSDLSTTLYGARYSRPGFIFDASGPMMFIDVSRIYRLIALVNSSVFQTILNIICPGLHYNNGAIAKAPLNPEVFDSKYFNIDDLAQKNVCESQTDWDSFETSWDFQRHSLIPVIEKNQVLFGNTSEIDLAECFMVWKKECEERFNKVKANEEELNRIFIDIYGLQDELKPEVDNKDVTVRKADLQREVKSLISYAVGCMFGRYSLDEDGLIFAGGEWDASRYKAFPADKDGIIPICDDEYFDDDIVGLFVKFVEKVYGREMLEKNLKFIADAIGGSGSSRDVIRN